MICDLLKRISIPWSQLLRAWGLPAFGICCVFHAVGCRSLRSNRQTQALSEARQYSLRGADKLQQEEWDDAEALFSEALRHSRADERAQWGMAEILWQQGQCARATEHMAQAAQISGENPDLLVRLGEMYLKEGNLDQALSQADLALRGNRQHAAAWSLRGQVLRRRNQLEEAMNCYHRALISRSDNPSVQVELAEIYHALGRPQRALATLDRMADSQSVERIPAKAWMLKGQALANLGEQSEAKACLRHAALCAQDDETQLLIQLAQSQFSSGDLAEARICLGRALRNDPHNPDALALQGTLDRSFKDFSSTQPLRTMPAGYEHRAMYPEN